MPRVFPAAALLVSAALASCTPTYNWREITLDSVALHATFPCKPDHAERKVQFAPGRDLVMHAAGCETGGVSYAVLWADLGSGVGIDTAMTQWKQASLATTHARVEREEGFVPRGALALPQSRQVRAAGERADGSAIQSQSAYFARGNAIFQVVVIAPALKPEMTEPFFAGLRFE